MLCIIGFSSSMCDDGVGLGNWNYGKEPQWIFSHSRVDCESRPKTFIRDAPHNGKVRTGMHRTIGLCGRAGDRWWERCRSHGSSADSVQVRRGALPVELRTSKPCGGHSSQRRGHPHRVVTPPSSPDSLCLSRSSHFSSHSPLCLLASFHLPHTRGASTIAFASPTHHSLSRRWRMPAVLWRGPRLRLRLGAVGDDES